MAAKKTWAELKKVTELADAPKTDRIALALALAEAEKAQSGFVADFVKTRPKRRRALYALLSVGRWLKLVNLPKARCEKIGWTKLGLLAAHCKGRPGQKPNRTEVDLAQLYTAAQLPSVLKVGLHNKMSEKPRSIMLRLTSAQYELFEAALKKYGATKPAKGKGLQNKEAALIALITTAQAAGV